jgi:hypothetical protein
MIAGLGISVLSACVTPRERMSRLPPASLDARFDSCLPGDGAVSAEVWQGEELAWSVEADWAAQADGRFRVAFSTTMGVPVARLEGRYHRPEHNLGWTKGPDTLPPMASDAEGYIVVEGRSTGIRVDEIPCFLKGRFPRGWLRGGIWYEREGTRMLETSQKRREVRLEAPESVKASQSLCARVSWNVFWRFYRAGLDVCLEGATTSLRPVGSHSGEMIRLRRLDESEGTGEAGL